MTRRRIYPGLMAMALLQAAALAQPAQAQPQQTFRHNLMALPQYRQTGKRKAQWKGELNCR